MSKETYIPQYLDEPERFLIFTPDELIAVVIPLAICTVVLNFAYGLGLSAIIFIALRKMKQGGGLQRLLWIGYWLLPADVTRLKATPPSHLREMAG
ncbi:MULTISPECIES: type IV conjugative transfer system protein TraL [unclassified Caulobacter]|mgnify:CR=1 FL=1|jgi:conjugal transfer pilus assembly protein TraL|uniref:type IV conjugative transfer system protein TraL n=1 Tax=unclassified Caulobacter TaxID=2648921 RepID=UPI0007865CF8|nr:MULTISPECIES: type IV conjugative transfer system protein TraL [unclassified Caulobacter]